MVVEAWQVGKSDEASATAEKLAAARAATATGGAPNLPGPRRCPQLAGGRETKPNRVCVKQLRQQQRGPSHQPKAEEPEGAWQAAPSTICRLPRERQRQQQSLFVGTACCGRSNRENVREGVPELHGFCQDQGLVPRQRKSSGRPFGAAHERSRQVGSFLATPPPAVQQGGDPADPSHLACLPRLEALPWALSSSLSSGHGVEWRASRWRWISGAWQCSTYARPLQVFSLIRPASGVTGYWSLLTSPEACLDSPYLKEWGPTLFAEMKRGAPDAPLWDFKYAQYLAIIKKCANAMQVSLTPHSGPSIDSVKSWRSQLAVQRRGQWKAAKSSMRYEKLARLARSWEITPARTQEFCTECESNLAIMSGRKSPRAQSASEEPKKLLGSRSFFWQRRRSCCMCAMLALFHASASSKVQHTLPFRASLSKASKTDLHGRSQWCP